MLSQPSGVESIFTNLDRDAVTKYQNYWKGLTVDTNADYFRRWLFAFMSVHTTWESNVSGYRAVADFTQWLGDDDDLLQRLKAGRAGLYNMRRKFISRFAEDFWSNPAAFHRGTTEPWWVFRDRLCKRVLGLGPAKTSFALEMAFPLEAQVACLDVHMLRLYGDEKAGAKRPVYNRFEIDWIDRCRSADVEPYVARMVYWDKLQGRTDSRYWSECLEG